MEQQVIDLSEIHDCEKCHNKMVCITIDKIGITRCAYCNQVVLYKQFIEKKLADYIKRNEKVM